MTTPTLRMLGRQLSRKGNAAPEKEGSVYSFMEAVEQAIGEQAEAKVEAAKEQQEKAENVAIELRKEIAKLMQESAKCQKEMAAKMEAMHTAAKAECDRMCQSHANEMRRVRDEINSLRQELASEQQARVRAESQLEAAKDMHSRMNDMVKNIKITAPAPVVQQTAASPKPATAKVTKRDGNGRIAEITITPSN